MGRTTGNTIADTEERFLFDLPPAAKNGPKRKFRERNPIWTECKAKLIERYLYYFVLITRHGTYIDGFAGPQETERHEMWAAKLVLESTPRWLRHFHLFELAKTKIGMLENLRESQPARDKKEPKRDINIYSGDFNENIIRMLTANPIRDKEAAFCLLDQRTFECCWDSVKTVATHKNGGNKIELFYFFPEGWIDRSIAAIKIQKNEKLTKWWGSVKWQELVERHGTERALFVAERFKREFGYKHVNPFAIYERKDRGGRIMYYMIHASDHDEAPTLMNRAYGKALDIKEPPEQLEFLKEQHVQP